MPIPASRGPAAAPAPTAAPAAAPGAPAPRLVRVLSDLPAALTGPEYPPLAETPLFAYFADPTSVQIVKGEAMYRPVKVPFEPGIQGIRSADSIAASVEYEQRTNRRVMVPVSREVTAWGQRLGGYIQQIDLAPDSRGKRRTHHADVWTRHDVVGVQVQTSFDMDGWLEFCRSLVDLLGPIHPGVLAGTRARIQELARQHRLVGHSSPGMARIADAIEAQLTPELP